MYKGAGSLIDVKKTAIHVFVAKGTLKTEYHTLQNHTILTFLQEIGDSQFQAPCGGKGICGKCLVRVDTGQGIQNVQACRTQVCDGMCIYLEQTTNMAVAELGTGMHCLADGTHSLAAACDLGTTTVVCHLLDGQSGQRLATVSAPNAQRSFGADVVSRIQASIDGRLDQMQDAAVKQLDGMLTQLYQIAGIKQKAAYLAIAGNTVMCHIVAKIAPDTIGAAPFTPMSLFGEEIDGAELGLKQANQVYIAPAVSGYVGGDITAGMLSAGMYTSSSQVSKDIETLFLDIGTNGEIVLGSHGDYLCCATAAGPAFEGAQISMGMPACTGAISKVWLADGRIQVSVIGGGEAKGICGSGLVDALAVFLEMGLIDETGLINETGCTAGTSACIYLTRTVCITQADIRQLQMAKAAVAAGIRILLKERAINVEQIGALALAGGFGSFLDLKNAAAIGLFPKELLPAACVVGNAAGEGAAAAAISAQARDKLSDIQKSLHYVELSAHPLFFDEYIAQMNFSGCESHM